MLIVADRVLSNRAANPYTALLYEACAPLGVRAVEPGDLRGSGLRRADVDVVHLHWPDHVWGKRWWLQAVALAVLEALRTLGWRLRGVPVVWTAHNVWAHGRRYPRSERAWWWVQQRLLTGWVSLTEAAVGPVVQAHPRLARLPHAVVPHGHYRSEYAPVRPPKEVRAAWGVPTELPLLVFAGRVKPYKGVPALLRAFADLPGDARLVVSGRCDDPDLRAEVVALAGADERVRLELAEMPAPDMADLVRAGDVLALPYLDVLNSGSAVLGLSCGTPVLLPDGPAAEELRALAPGWVHSYAALSADVLARALAAPRPEGQPALAELEWDAVAGRMVAFYRAVAARRR